MRENSHNIFIVAFEENLSVQALQKLKFIKRVIFISKPDPMLKIQKFTLMPSNDFLWKDLSMGMKKKIRSRELKFHDKSIALSITVAWYEDFLKEITIEEALNLHNLKITNTTLPALPKVFIDREFVATHSESTFLDSSDVLDLIASKRFVILADEAGMGKSTSAIYLANKLQQRDELSWVVYLDLKKYIKHFENCNVVDSSFFVELLFAKVNSFEAILFKHFLASKKVVFVLDGFDEISPKFKDFVLKIIRGIVRLKNRFLVTTRTFLKDEIKKIFDECIKTDNEVEVQVLTLTNFSFECRVKFFVLHWKQNSSTFTLDELTEKAQTLLRSVDRATLPSPSSFFPYKIFDTIHYDFFQPLLDLCDSVFANPLNLYMLSQTFPSPETVDEEVCSNLNMFDLFENFFKKKLEILRKEKGELASEDQSASMMGRSTPRIIHQKLALEDMEDKRFAKILMLEEVTDREFISRIGMLQIFENGDVTFLHKAYSEYFVADFILHNITDRSYHKDCDLLHELFVKVLNEKSHENIRNFIDHKLREPREFELDSLTRKLNQSLSIKENQSFLSILIKEKRYALLKFMLVTVRFEKNLKFKIIEKKDPLKRNCFVHAAMQKDANVFKAFWQGIESFTEQTEQKALLLKRTNYNFTFFGDIIRANNEAVINFVVELLKSWNVDDIREIIFKTDSRGNTILHVAVERGDINSLKALWILFDGVLNEEQMKNQILMKNKKGENSFFRAAYNKDVETVKQMIELFKKLLDPEEYKQAFTERSGEYQENVLHKAAFYAVPDIFKALFSAILEFLGPDGMKYFLRQQDKYRNTVFQKLEMNTERKSWAMSILASIRGYR